MVGDPITEIW